MNWVRMFATRAVEPEFRHFLRVFIYKVTSRKDYTYQTRCLMQLSIHELGRYIRLDFFCYIDISTRTAQFPTIIQLYDVYMTRTMKVWLDICRCKASLKTQKRRSHAAYKSCGKHMFSSEALTIHIFFLKNVTSKRYVDSRVMIMWKRSSKTRLFILRIQSLPPHRSIQCKRCEN